MTAHRDAVPDAGGGTLAGAIAVLRLVLGLLLWSSGAQPPAGPETAPAIRTATVIIDRQLVLFEQDGREANLALASTGRPGFGTPKGTFTVRYRIRNPLSSIYLVHMPFWVCLDRSGEIGFHQAPTRRSIALLGQPFSHGCIRLGRNVAPWVYNWLGVGSAVEVR
jgi:lipoprotein-anchoring transpeptidase ErfK/SrfK